jgi:hypothetical protein
MIWIICSWIVYLFEAIVFAGILLAIINLIIPIEEQPEILATASKIIFELDDNDLYEHE